ncbi:hypothetical protein MAR_028819 [Mya arenaria]|uniref:Uncharacterized protein n=1 Tax=Mya arenaria TaxID=6604 RepID=A0ABY7DFS1_MYAAR|nr:hypothetical protein MAR_028819 [Mya arenaria]
MHKRLKIDTPSSGERETLLYDNVEPGTRYLARPEDFLPESRCTLETLRTVATKLSTWSIVNHQEPSRIGPILLKPEDFKSKKWSTFVLLTETVNMSVFGVKQQTHVDLSSDVRWNIPPEELLPPSAFSAPEIPPQSSRSSTSSHAFQRFSRTTLAAPQQYTNETFTQKCFVLKSTDGFENRPSTSTPVSTRRPQTYASNSVPSDLKSTAGFENRSKTSTLFSTKRPQTNTSKSAFKKSACVSKSTRRKEKRVLNPSAFGEQRENPKALGVPYYLKTPEPSSLPLPCFS